MRLSCSDGNTLSTRRLAVLTLISAGVILLLVGRCLTVAAL